MTQPDMAELGSEEVFELKKYLSGDYEKHGEDAVPYETQVLTYIDGKLVSYTVNGGEVNYVN